MKDKLTYLLIFALIFIVWACGQGIHEHEDKLTPYEAWAIGLLTGAAVFCTLYFFTALGERHDPEDS